MLTDSKSIQEYLKTNPFVLAPMVDHSDLPFRMITRKHGAGLCFTPMIHARLYVDDKNYRTKIFKTHTLDRPLVCQIAGDDPDVLLQAAQLLQPFCDIIDINFGCPQGIAKRGNYGSYLLENEEQVYKIVEHVSKNLTIPLSCKIRLFKDRERTFKLVQEIEKRGCQLLTVHGRTKEQNKDTVGSADWEAIKKIKSLLSIPVILNGGIANYQDLKISLDKTGVDGIMSAEAILEYPALFSAKNEVGLIDNDQLVEEYLECCDLYPDQEYFIKSHLFKMLFTGFQTHVDLREKLTSVRTIEEYKSIAKEIGERRKGVKAEDKLGWYYRYWKKMELSKQILDERVNCSSIVEEEGSSGVDVLKRIKIE